MGEWTGVSIKFGGKLKREQADDLIAAIMQNQLRVFVTDDDPTILNLNLEFGGEANYGQIEEVTGACQLLGIEYEQVIKGCSAFDGSITRYVGGQLESLNSDEDGEALIPLKQVLEIETLTQGMANLINLAKFWAKPLVLEIIP